MSERRVSAAAAAAIDSSLILSNCFIESAINFRFSLPR